MLKNPVQCSVGGKRDGGHSELYSDATRGFGGSLRNFGASRVGGGGASRSRSSLTSFRA